MSTAWMHAPLLDSHRPRSRRRPALRRRASADANSAIPPATACASWRAAPGAEGAQHGGLHEDASGARQVAGGDGVVVETPGRHAVASGIDELSDAQELLWASDRYAVLVVLQAMDAAGKDSAIEHVMSGVNPQGVQVFSFKKPSSEELDHNFLWRTSKALPERGRIGIFNRSHYEEVVALKVHPEWLEPQRLPAGDRGERFWEERDEDLDLDYVPQRARPLEVPAGRPAAALSNSFGFGGHNAVLVLEAA